MYRLLGFKAILFERRFGQHRQKSGGRFLISAKYSYCNLRESAQGSTFVNCEEEITT